MNYSQYDWIKDFYFKHKINNGLFIDNIECVKNEGYYEKKVDKHGIFNVAFRCIEHVLIPILNIENANLTEKIIKICFNFCKYITKLTGNDSKYMMERIKKKEFKQNCFKNCASFYVNIIGNIKEYETLELFRRFTSSLYVFLTFLVDATHLLYKYKKDQIFLDSMLLIMTSEYLIDDIYKIKYEHDNEHKIKFFDKLLEGIKEKYNDPKEQEILLFFTDKVKKEFNYREILNVVHNFYFFFYRHVFKEHISSVLKYFDIFFVPKLKKSTIEIYKKNLIKDQSFDFTLNIFGLFYDESFQYYTISPFLFINKNVVKILIFYELLENRKISIVNCGKECVLFGKKINYSLTRIYPKEYYSNAMKIKLSKNITYKQHVDINQFIDSNFANDYIDTFGWVLKEELLKVQNNEIINYLMEIKHWGEIFNVPNKIIFTTKDVIFIKNMHSMMGGKSFNNQHNVFDFFKKHIFNNCQNVGSTLIGYVLFMKEEYQRIYSVFNLAELLYHIVPLFISIFCSAGCLINENIICSVSSIIINFLSNLISTCLSCSNDAEVLKKNDIIINSAITNTIKKSHILFNLNHNI